MASNSVAQPFDEENPAPSQLNASAPLDGSQQQQQQQQQQRSSQRLNQIPPKLLGVRSGVVSGAPVPPTPASVLDAEDPTSAAESDALLAEGLSRTNDKKRSQRRLVKEKSESLAAKLGLSDPA